MKCVEHYLLQMFFFFPSFSLDPELKEPLVEVIERLLKDKTTVSFVFVESLYPPTSSKNIAL